MFSRPTREVASVGGGGCREAVTDVDGFPSVDRVDWPGAMFPFVIAVDMAVEPAIGADEPAAEANEIAGTASLVEEVRVLGGEEI